MQLAKWYLDAVLPDGTVWYGYQARLRLAGLPTIPWASGCQVRPDGTEHKVSRWRPWPAPFQTGNTWHWKGPDGFHARWLPTQTGPTSRLGSDEQFQVHWNCVAPRASVSCKDSAQTSSSHNARGLGYIEHLQLETRGPAMPFRRLWWGRAHAGDSTLVWIRWEQGRDLSLLVEDGKEIPGTIQTLQNGGLRVQTPTGLWETGRARPLCNRDVRRAFPRWLAWLAGRMAPSRELKLTGTVRRQTSAGETEGSGIWEEVTWS